MALRSTIVLLALLALNPVSRAAVLVVGNYTLADVTLTIADPDQPPRKVTLASYDLAPIPVTGAVDVTIPTRNGVEKYHLEPYNAYVLLVDPKSGVRLEGIQLVGDQLPEDTKPGEGPVPKLAPVKVPVTLCVDDVDPRTDRVWQAALKKRFEEAADIIEKHSGIKFELKGFGTWNSEPMAFEPTGMLEDFQKKFRVKDGEVAIGYSSRKVEDKPEIPFGATRGVLAQHVLMREARPKNEAEKVEALVHYLAQVAGAVLTPDPGSVMRPRIANGLAIAADYKIRFDPLNTLAMAIWAEELRKGPRLTIMDVTPANKVRLNRVYKAMLAALPEDRTALNNANQIDDAMAMGRPKPAGVQNPPKPNADPPPPLPMATGRAPQQEAVRQVVLAVATRAELNSQLPASDPDRLRGDALLEAYVKTAADTAWAAEEQFRVTAFVVGLGIALDEAGLLREDSQTASFVKGVETEGEWQKRLALLGSPTLRSRRDLCQRFTSAAATADLIGASTAEDASVKRAVLDMNRPTGFSFPALAADLAGVELSQQVKGSPELVGKWRRGFRAAEIVPALDGLRDGLSQDRFEQDYGGSGDGRFAKVLEDIRNRVAKVTGYRRVD